jgi:endonuclease YncB( thermonuclease family)
VNRPTSILAGVLGLAASAVAPSASAQTGTVKINGIATPVFFNDGDTFRSLAGPYRNRSARLAGYNTLESYGPAHQWGGWTAREMYSLAKQATLNARRGLWNCALDPKDKDGYGRFLAICPDLQYDQIKNGFAHVLSVDGDAPKRLMDAQRDAIINGRGIWAKGVPAMIVTSTHAANERFDTKDNYNRLVSPLDGSSLKWKHQNNYDECENVCWKAKTAERSKLIDVIAALRADERTKPVVHGFEDPYLLAMLAEYVATERVPHIFLDKGDIAVKAKLDELLKSGAFGTLKETDSSCMIYVGFDRRYRIPPKPRCLK